jgi:hypothetical protein
MNQMLALLFTFFSFFVSASAFADSGESTLPGLLAPGTVLVADLGAAGKRLNGATYWALSRVEDKFLLSKTRIIYTSDEDAADISSSVDNVVVYIRNNNITSGDVPTALYTVSGSKPSKSLHPYGPQAHKLIVNDRNIPAIAADVPYHGGKIKFTLGGHSYLAYVQDSSFYLAEGERKSSLSEVGVGLDIIWAGDMDGDGKLDLIINASSPSEKNSETCLYLSSAAGGTELVKAVACEAFSG